MNEKKIMLLGGCVILVMVAALGTWAAPQNVPGQPFQQLQDQTDQLSADVATLTSIINNLGNSAVTGTGVDGFLPLWNGTQSLEGSAIFQSASGNVGIGTMAPTVPLQVEGDVKVAGGLSVGDATVTITSEDIIFPDGILQTTAFTGESGDGGVEEDTNSVNWTGIHTWKTESPSNPGSGATLKTFSTTMSAGTTATLVSIPVPNNTGMLIAVRIGGILGVGFENEGSTGVLLGVTGVSNIEGTLVIVGLETLEFDIERNDLDVDEVSIVVNGTNLELRVENPGLEPQTIMGWVQYTSAPIP